MQTARIRDGWVEIATAADDVERELIRGRLEVEGIEVVAEPVSFGEVPVPANADFSACHLWVRQGDAERARQSLRERVGESELERAAVGPQSDPN